MTHTTNMNFDISAVLKSYIPAQTADERDRLLKSIKSEGVREPLIVGVLPDGTRLLVDGHHRWSCAEELADVTYDVVEKEFISFAHIKSYMRDIQLGRRNISKKNRDKLITDEYNLTVGVREIVSRFRKSASKLNGGHVDPRLDFWSWANSGVLAEEEQGLLFNIDLIEEVLAKPELKSDGIVGAKFEVSGSTVKRAVKSRKDTVQSLDNPFWIDLSKIPDSVIEEHYKYEDPPTQDIIDSYSENIYDAWVADGSPDLKKYQDYITLKSLKYISMGVGLGFERRMAEIAANPYKSKSDYKTEPQIKDLRMPEEEAILEKQEQETIDFIISNPGSTNALINVSDEFLAKCRLNKINIINTEKGYYSIPKSIADYLTGSFYAMIQLNPDDNFKNTVIVGKYAELLLKRVDQDNTHQKLIEMSKTAMKAKQTA